MAQARLKRFLIAALVATAVGTPAVATAATVHENDRDAPATFTKLADGSVKADTGNTTVTYTPAEAKTFGDLVKPDPPPPIVSKPGVPTGLSASGGDAKVTLTWTANAPADNVDAYQVYQCVAGSTTDCPLVKDGVTATNFTVTGLTNGTTYNFRVGAHNSAGYGEWSAPATAVPQGATSGRPAVAFWLTQTGNGGSGFATSASRDEAVIAQGFWRPDITDPFKAAGKKAFVYKNLTRLVDPGAAGEYSSCLKKTEGNSSGNPYGAQWTSTVSDPDTFYNGVIARPVQPQDYANFCADRLIAQYNDARAAGHPIDGYFMDDVNVYSCPNQGGLPDSDFNGSTCTAADDTAWENWVTAVDQTLTARLRAAGILVSGNMAAAWGDYSVQGNQTWFNTNLPLFDFPFAEMSFSWPNGTAQSQADVDETIRLVKHVAANNRVAVLNVPSATPAAGHEFAVGVCLVHAPGNCVKSNRIEGTGAESWLAAYDRAKALGQPTGPAVNTSAGVWTRAYGSKTVTVNQNTRAATIP